MKLHDRPNSLRKGRVHLWHTTKLLEDRSPAAVVQHFAVEVMLVAHVWNDCLCVTVANQQDITYKIIRLQSMTCRHDNDTNAAWVVSNSATQVDRGRQPPVAPILAPLARWLTDYACLVQAASSSLIERNSLLITAAVGNVKSIDGSIKHDSFATQHRVASIHADIVNCSDVVCVVLAACDQAETPNSPFTDFITLINNARANVSFFVATAAYRSSNYDQVRLY